MIVLAIDPGPTRSAWLVFNTETKGIRAFAISPNEELLDMMRRPSPELDCVVIERMQGMGMAVGDEVFETVRWSGRFEEAVQPIQVERLTRRDVKQHLCGSDRAKDPNVRQVLLDRFGGSTAKGTKKAPGPLFGVADDVWSALAVAVTYAEQLRRAA